MTAHRPPVVGVDVGGTAIKALLVAADGRCLAEDRTRTPRPGSGHYMILCGAHGGSSQSANWSNTTKAMRVGSSGG